MKKVYFQKNNNKQLHNQKLIWHVEKSPQDAEAHDRFHY
jgi:hypothetical protein